MITRQFAAALDLTDVDEQFLERFWSKVDRRGPDECWPWLAYRQPTGYGQFTVRKGEFATASRVALALTVDRPLVLGEVACHSCDNPPCCNPAHLFVGTQLDNNADCRQKGRANRARGVGLPWARLDDEKVREIRSHPQRYGLYAELGRQYGVAANTIRAVRQGTKWRHVA